VPAAAVRVVEEKGLSALSMQELAGALGIILSSLYNHISGLEEAQNHVMQYTLEELVKELKEAIIGCSGDEAYLEIAIAFRQFALAHPELYNAIRLCQKAPEFKIKEENQEPVCVMHRISDRYSHIDKQTKTHFVCAFRSCIFGFISTEITGGFNVAVDIDESYQIMVKHIISMLPSPLTEQTKQKENNHGKDN
jgi:AcrR family transcriptional regulator